jgi:hypothetical protein
MRYEGRRVKKLGAVVFAALMVVGASQAGAQLKSQIEQEPPVSDAITRQPEPVLLFGWFDPSKFSMQHSLSMSYQTMGGQGMSLGMYTNSMLYQFSHNLNARADVSLMYSPYNSFSTPGSRKNDLSSIFLSRAELNYSPWDNVLLRLEYQRIPWGNYYNNSPFYNPWFREGGF